MQLANIGQQATMSSLELVDFINSQRGEKEADITHSDFLKKVLKVLGNDAGKFSSVYIGGNGQNRPCYNFPKREACLMAMSYSYDLQAKVFDRMTELEAKQAQSPAFNIPTTLSGALRLAAEQAETIEQQNELIALQAPKVIVYDMLADRKQDVSTTIIAKQLGTTAIQLNKFLREQGVKWQNADLPKAGYMDWFSVISDVKNGYEFQQCVVTPLGQIKIAELWAKFK